jgi:Cd2+/Zn2+-exporting ATPase
MSAAAPTAFVAPDTLDPEAAGRLRVVFGGGVFILSAVVLRWLSPDQAQVADLLAIVGTLIVAAPIVRDVLGAFKSSGYEATQFYMDQFVVIALAACLVAGSYVTGGVVAIILILGQMLEERAVVGVEQTLARLAHLSRVRATRLREDGTEEAVDSADLRVGDRVRIRPGEAVPADASVVSGSSSVDQSSITGESLPVEILPGSEIFAGSTNLSGLVEATVTKTGDDTLMGRVIHIIDEARRSEAPIVRMAEEYARYYTPLVLLVAAAVFFFTRDLNRSVSVIIVSIPCAFVLASPSAVVAAIAASSRLGILVKRVRHFETAGLCDCVVFDKTGTLTQGQLAVDDVVPAPGFDAATLLRAAAAVERHVSHPVARAIVRRAVADGGPPPPDIPELREEPGLGVAGIVPGLGHVRVGRLSWLESLGLLAPDVRSTLADSPGSVVGVSVDDRFAGHLSLHDEVRPESPSVLERLRQLGAGRFVMLTGDRHAVAARIAARLGLDRFRADCLPADKKSEVDRLKAEGRRVIVVGDGVNDAPALTAADTSVAMGAMGNDIAISAADVALMNNNLHRLVDFLLLSRLTVGVINQNLIFGFLFILVAIAASGMGWINPVAAAFVHEFSAFFVILNSARLLRYDAADLADADPAV